MNVEVIKIVRDQYGVKSDIRVIVETRTNDGVEDTVSIGEGEPEDMSLGRDLNDIYKLPDMLKMAYEAGKNEEGFNIVEKEEEY